MNQLVKWTDGVYINTNNIVQLRREGAMLYVDLSTNTNRAMLFPSEEDATTKFEALIAQINKTRDVYEYINREIEALRLEIHYRPEGLGALEAQQEFEQLSKS